MLREVKKLNNYSGPVTEVDYT